MTCAGGSCSESARRTQGTAGGMSKISDSWRLFGMFCLDDAAATLRERQTHPLPWLSRSSGNPNHVLEGCSWTAFS